MSLLEDMKNIFEVMKEEFVILVTVPGWVMETQQPSEAEKLVELCKLLIS